MTQELLQEYTEFYNTIKELRAEVIDAVKTQVIQKHSVYEDYDTENMRRKTKFRTVESINMYTSLYSSINTNIISGYVTENTHYSLNVSVYTDDNTGISDGQVYYWVWKHLESKIDLSKFPNFKVPKFDDEQRYTNQY